MYIKKRLYLLLSLILFIFNCVSQVGEIEKEYPEYFTVAVKNPTEMDRTDELITMDINDVKLKYANFNANACVVIHNGIEMASQAIDDNGDDAPDYLVYLLNLKAGETKRLTVRYSIQGKKSREYKKRTQAELSVKVGGKFEDRKYVGGQFQNVNFLSVPPEHTDHSFYIRYEGPGWESDKIGYRFYLDWRNAIDIFGKKVTEMVLQDVGQDGFDSYHEMSDWGMDILKVGDALGIGAVGMWYNGKVERVSKTDSVTCGIISNGSIYSQIRTKYFGWKVGKETYDLQSDLSIHAGNHLTEHGVKISGNALNLCTGIVKHEEGLFIKSLDDDLAWAYVATYGKQSLADDNLGLAVLYKKIDLIEISEDSFNHVVVLKPADGCLTYFFLGAWEKEPGGIQTREEFQQYLEMVRNELAMPLEISLIE